MSAEQNDVAVSLGADSEIVDEARVLDWGALVVESQGGVSVFVVGLDERDAATLLRKAADALDPKPSPEQFKELKDALPRPNVDLHD